MQPGADLESARYAGCNDMGAADRGCLGGIGLVANVRHGGIDLVTACDLVGHAQVHRGLESGPK